MTADNLDTLRARLETLNELIYEPEEHMQASERTRRIRERDEVFEQIQELETNENE